MLHPMGSNTSQNSHPTQLKNPKTHTKNQQQGPGWDLEIKSNMAALLQENPSSSQKRPCSPQKSDLQDLFLFSNTSQLLLASGRLQSKAPTRKEAPHAQVVVWVSFFIKSLLLLSGNSQDQPRT